MTETNAPVHNQPQPAPVKRNEVLRFVYVLNIVSCFAVVLLHTTLPVYSPSRLGIGWRCSVSSRWRSLRYRCSSWSAA